MDYHSGHYRGEGDKVLGLQENLFFPDRERKRGAVEKSLAKTLTWAPAILLSPSLVALSLKC